MVKTESITDFSGYSDEGFILGYSVGKKTRDGNAYACTVPPTASVGQNGDYYFELNDTVAGLQREPNNWAQTDTAGWEFTVNEDITVSGARGLSRSSSYVGTIKLADVSGTVLAEKDVSLVAGAWVSVDFDNPVALTAGNNYIIMLFGQPSSLMYQHNPTTVPQITYVQGRYGGLPGSAENGTAYSADILIQGARNPPYPFKTQYYKTRGEWGRVWKSPYWS